METKKGLTGLQLKLGAACLMVLDHIYQFLTAPLWFTWLGRLVAPVFLFMAAEGFVHTRNRKRYLMRLLWGFWVMSAGNALLLWIFPSPGGGTVLVNNIFGTLFLGVLYMWLIEALGHRLGRGPRRASGEGCDDRVVEGWRLVLYLVTPVAVSLVPFLLLEGYPVMARIVLMAVPNVFACEGGPLIILLAVVFYLQREQRVMQCVTLVLFGALCAIGNPPGMSLLWDNYQWMMAFAAIPLYGYNGQKGGGGAGAKYFFYWFYPLHIYVLFILSQLVPRAMD